MRILEGICMEFADNAEWNPEAKTNYQALQKKHSINVDQFETTLSKVQRAMILELETDKNLLCAMEIDHAFIHGFRSGVQMMLEILYG